MSVVSFPTQRTASGRFAKGKSGNPAGRPKGARNRQTVLEEQLLDAGPAVMDAAVQSALAGDRPMLRAFVGRLLPRAPEPTIELDLPAGAEREDEAVFDAVIRALADGAISPAEALRVGRLVALRARMREGKVRLKREEARTEDARAAAGRRGARPVSDLYFRRENAAGGPLAPAAEGGDPARSAGEGGGSRRAAIDQPTPLAPPLSRKGERESAPVSGLYFSRAGLRGSTALARAEFGRARLRSSSGPAI